MGQTVLGCAVYKCQGPYVPEFSEKSPPGVGIGASWHPGRRGHQMRGENLAYFLLSVLEDALKAMEPTVHNCLMLANSTSQSVSEARPLLTLPSSSAVASTRPASASIKVSDLYHSSVHMLAEAREMLLNPMPAPASCDPAECSSSSAST